jgi:hypothetical protein
VIPEAVRKLIAEYIDSVEQLEVLILLRSRRDRPWTIDEIDDHIISCTPPAGPCILQK